MVGVITIQFNNWHKRQPRKDYEMKKYFLFYTDFFLHPDLGHFTGEEAHYALYLLTEASRVGDHGKVTVSSKVASALVKFDEKFFYSTIEKLKQINWLNIENETVTESIRKRNESDTKHLGIVSQDKDKDKDKDKETTLTLPLKKTGGAGVPVFEAYSFAYEKRYKVKPVRNVKQNSLACSLRKRLGLDPAIQVVQFYLSHNDKFYVNSLHSLGICLRDAEKLHTEWSSGNKVNSITAKKTEAVSHTISVMENYLKQTKKLERETNERRILEKTSDTSNDL